MRRHPLKKLLAGTLGLILAGCLWFYFAPAPLGGSTSYVVTHGVSMQPRFHTGDLAIVRSKSAYHVGEIVAYHNKMLHTTVLHRIIGREGERFIFKGDNNNFIDPEHPRASQLIGALWIHVAGAGRTLQSFGNPARAGLLIAIGMLLLTGGVFARRRRRRGRERRSGGATPRAPRTRPLNARAPAAAISAIGVLLLLPFVVLALLAFTRAPSTRHAVQIPYTQSATLSYSADMAPNPAYPDGVASTGEPLFTQLVNDVNFRFDYRFATSARHSVAGKGSFLLLVTASDGWHRTLPLGSPTYFKGDHATIADTLSLSWLLALTRSLEAATRVDGSYAFAIVPSVVTSGKVEDMPLHASFSPPVQFAINSDEINLESGGSAIDNQSKLLAGGGTSGGGALPPELKPSASGSITGEQSKPRTIALGPWNVAVSTARTLTLVAIAVILAALLGALALIRPMLAFLAPRRREQSASIHARYRHLIVPVEHVWQLPGVPVIDVADMAALARIAEHYDRSILHEATADGDAFWVADESGQFRFALGAPALSDGYELADDAWPADGQLDAPAWPVEEAADAPEWTVEAAADAPAWTVEAAADAPAWAVEAAADTAEHDTLVHPVAWAVPEDQETFVQEGVDRRRTDEPGDTSLLARADVNQAPAPARIADFTGLEWTANS
jgi:signal peptidase I